MTLFNAQHNLKCEHLRKLIIQNLDMSNLSAGFYVVYLYICRKCFRVLSKVSYDVFANLSAGFYVVYFL